MPYDFDLFTIGAGSGGVRASRFAANYGARVAIAEERYLGGTCVNVGCIPKKLFSYAAHFHDDIEDAAGYGWNIDKSAFDWPTLVANKDREITRLNGVYKRLLDGAGVTTFDTRATVIDAHSVEVGGKRVTAKHILIATGGWPVKPAIPGVEFAITSNEAFHLTSLPKRIVIVGGGYIAVEFASIFHGLGVETILVYRGERLLKSFDADLGEFLAEQMKAKGIDLRFQCNIAAISREDAKSGELISTLTDGTQIKCYARHRPRAEQQRFRPRKSRRHAQRQRCRQGGCAFSNQRAVNSRHWRRYGPRFVDAGGTGRGHGGRSAAVWQERPHAVIRKHCNRHFHQSECRHRRFV